MFTISRNTCSYWGTLNILYLYTIPSIYVVSIYVALFRNVLQRKSREYCIRFVMRLISAIEYSRMSFFFQQNCLFCFCWFDFIFFFCFINLVKLFIKKKKKKKKKKNFFFFLIFFKKKKCMLSPYNPSSFSFHAKRINFYFFFILLLCRYGLT